VKIGDVIKLPKGCSNHWGLPTGIAILVAKTPRTDYLEYDWSVFVDGRFIGLGRQIEDSAEVLNENR
jgi:hypothetical protein